MAPSRDYSLLWTARVPLPFPCWSPNPHCDCIGEWACKEVIRLNEVTEWGSPEREDLCPYKKRHQREQAGARPVFLSLPLRYLRSMQWKGGQLQPKKQALPRNHIGWHLELGLFSLRNWEIHCCCRHRPVQWCFVTASGADNTETSESELRRSIKRMKFKMQSEGVVA